MGRVWRATDVVLHRDVAIKELVPPPGLTPEERQEMRERSLREARAIARLNNVNVVRIFDVLRTDADPWIVMEYVASRSLQDILAADGPFPPVRAAEIGLGVLNALRAAHLAGVVHRDVKPGNVLIGEDGRVVLTDFGLATVPGDPTVTRTGLVLGSPAYIAPERARDGTAGPGADLWSLGATLYAAVEGASPFARPSAIATLAALATESPPPARNAGPLKPVLNGLLRKDPTHRINTDEAERLLLRATGRRSKLSLPMSPTMRRPGVGRERPALPGNPPVVPGARGVSGSAPVVPGPRPPVTPARPPVSPPATGRPPVSPPAAGHPPAAGPRPEGRPPVFAPGKASVGRSAPSAETPTRVDGPKIETLRLDTTRLDTPPVRESGRPSPDQDQPLSGTGTTAPNLSGPAASDAPPTGTAPAQDAAGRGALAKGTRGVFGTISAAEIAAHRKRFRQRTPDPALERVAAEQAERAEAERAEAERVAAEQAGTERAQAERASAQKKPAERAAAEKAVADQTAVEEAAAKEAAEQAALDRATAQWTAAEQAVADIEAAPEPATRNAPAQRTNDKATPATEVPVTEVPVTEVPVAEEPGTEAAGTEAAGTEAAGTEAAGTEAAAMDSAGDAAGDDVAASIDETGDPRANDRAAASTSASPGEADAAGADPNSAAVSKPEVGARFGAASSSKASRRRSRGRTAGTAAAAGATSGGARAGTTSNAGTPPNAPTTSAVGAAASVSGATSSTDQSASADPSTSGDIVTSGGSSASGASPTDAAEAQAPTAGPPTAEPGLPDDPTDLDAKIAVAHTGDREVTATVGDDGVGVPSAVGPSRPAWTPMPVQLPTSGGKGVTVLGTTLTRRQTLIGGAILLALVLAVVLIVSLTVGGDGDKDRKAGPAATAGRANGGIAGPATAAPSPTQPTSAASSAPRSSAPASSAPEGAVKLPAGWTMYHDPTGFSVPIPAGASIRRQGSEVYFSKDNRLLIVDQTDQPQPDPVADWTQQEGARIGRVYRNYHRIKIVPVDYFTKAADWEFTYTTNRGNPQHAVKRGVITGPKQAYGISWYTSPGDWAGSLPYLQLIYQGFQPKR